MQNILMNLKNIVRENIDIHIKYFDAACTDVKGGKT